MRRRTTLAAKAAFSMGLDFGTNSARALLVNVRDGREIATAVAAYPSGTRGVLLDRQDPNLARQHPTDYAVALTRCVRAALRAAAKTRGFTPERVVGMGVDTTASTPLPVDEHCVPLGCKPAFKNDLNACAWLWKDHTSHAEADRITDLARRERPEYVAGCGGVYSSEWFWSKILHCTRVAPKVARAADSWLELCDYIPALLTGCDEVSRAPRGVCAAGHKAMFRPGSGLPAADFLRRLHPGLGKLRARLYDHTHTSDQVAGELSSDWARKLGLPAGIPVAVGTIDAHAGAVGAGVRPGRLVKILGTSSCDMLVAPTSAPVGEIPGLCGVVDGSILPGHYGIEAGQAAVGDIFNWFVTHFDGRRDAHERLTAEAQRLRPGVSGLVALDWNNGNRSVLADPRLTGLLVGQTLQTSRSEVYRAMLEATAFGARVILERLELSGIRVREIVNCGGIAEKNPLLVQIYADVTGRPMKLARSAQTCALGAAIFGAVAAGPRRGGHASVERAQRAMCGLKSAVFKPSAPARRVYDELFAIYQRLHDAFGVSESSGPTNTIMKDLIRLRERTRASS